MGSIFKQCKSDQCREMDATVKPWRVGLTCETLKILPRYTQHSNIQFGRERVFLNELAARLNNIAHQP